MRGCTACRSHCPVGLRCELLPGLRESLLTIRGSRLGLPDHGRWLADGIDTGGWFDELSVATCVPLEALIDYGPSFLSRILGLGVWLTACLFCKTASWSTTDGIGFSAFLFAFVCWPALGFAVLLSDSQVTSSSRLGRLSSFFTASCVWCVRESLTLRALTLPVPRSFWLLPEDPRLRPLACPVGDAPLDQRFGQ